MKYKVLKKIEDKIFDLFSNHTKMVYLRHVIFFRAPLDKNNSIQKKELGGIKIRVLRENELHILKDILEPKYNHTLNDNPYCIVAEKNKKIIGFFVLTSKELFYECFFLHIKPLNGELLGVGNAIIDEKYRNKGIMSAIYRYANNELSKEGYAFYEGCINYKNHPMIGVVKKLKDLKKFHIIIIVFFHRWKFFIRNDSPERISFSIHKYF